jgi:cell division protein FtsQ
MTYLHVAGWIAVSLVGAWGAYASGHFLYASPQMALIHPEQVELTGNQNVPRARVLEVFAADRNRSVLRIPLDERRRQLEAIPWVERATVRRALPNRIEIEIVERTPIAYLRQGSELSLVDARGAILERPTKAAFHFPVVTGISPVMAQEDRERRMHLYADFARQIEAARSGALEKVSEVDLADVNDLRANLTGLGGASAGTNAAANTSPSSTNSAEGQADAPLLVHFGDGDFETKYRNLVENIGQWRATAGRVDSVDMRFSREAVVNPEPKITPAPPAQKAAPERSPAPKLTSAPKSSPAQKTSIARRSISRQKSSGSQHTSSAQRSSGAKKSRTAKRRASKAAHPAAKPAT